MVEFVCGASLPDLFSQHYKEVLLDSGVLTTYLSALRSGLQKDDALLQIILRNSFLADVPTSFHEMYVSQNYSQTLRRVSPGASITSADGCPHQATNGRALLHFAWRMSPHSVSMA
jgi:hypothetical protein